MELVEVEKITAIGVIPCDFALVKSPVFTTYALPDIELQ
jgi:hypothetical protein